MSNDVSSAAGNGTPVEAKKERDSQFVGLGCFIQIIGVFIILGTLPMPWPTDMIGIALGIIVILIAGARKRVFWRCGHCGNRLADKKVKICPTCHAILK